jgi:DNA invertase Pin-like site-specific DNA recombinase
VLGAVAQFEKELMLERTMVGLAAARADGRVVQVFQDRQQVVQ